MSEAFDFVKNYDDLFKANEVEQNRVKSLRSVKEALEKEIIALRKKINDIEQIIKDKVADSDKALKERHAHAEHNFEVERIRLATLSRSLEEKGNNLQKAEDSQRHRESELNQRGIALDDRDSKLEQWQSKVIQDGKDNELKSQANASVAMEQKKEWQAIDIAKKNNAEEKQGLDNLRVIAKSELGKSGEEKKKNVKRSQELDAREVASGKREKLIEEGFVKLASHSKDLNIQQAAENKRKKDNDDKEKALKAMQTEVEFKLAQLKRLKK